MLNSKCLKLLGCSFFCLIIANCGSEGGDSTGNAENGSGSGSIGGTSSGGSSNPIPTVAELESLGQKLFSDTNFSNPPGLSCESCHSPGHALVDPDDNRPVSEGAITGRFGIRNSPTVSYARFIPPFSSKSDAVKMGLDVFTTEEASGEQIFRDVKCGRCHTNDGPSPLFTNFEYENIGVPGNTNNPFLTLDNSLNPDGANFVDRGLGRVIADPLDDGKFRTPSLRNIESTGPYMHNGIFATLEEVLDFYNVRNISDAEVDRNVVMEDVGNLNLTEAQKADLIAFMLTLTDENL
jgi:cytochrome c peroxidase